MQMEVQKKLHEQLEVSYSSACHLFVIVNFTFISMFGRRLDPFIILAVFSRIPQSPALVSQ